MLPEVEINASVISSVAISEEVSKGFLMPIKKFSPFLVPNTPTLPPTATTPPVMPAFL